MRPAITVGKFPMREGWDASFNGKPAIKCPYPVGSDDWNDWRIGWFARESIRARLERAEGRAA